MFEIINEKEFAMAFVGRRVQIRKNGAWRDIAMTEEMANDEKLLSSLSLRVPMFSCLHVSEGDHIKITHINGKQIEHKCVTRKQLILLRDMARTGFMESAELLLSNGYWKSLKLPKLEM